MATQHDPNDIDPKEYEKAQALWAKFTEATKWSIIGVSAILALMALAFIR